MQWAQCRLINPEHRTDQHQHTDEEEEEVEVEEEAEEHTTVAELNPPPTHLVRYEQSTIIQRAALYALCLFVLAVCYVRMRRLTNLLQTYQNVKLCARNLCVSVCVRLFVCKCAVGFCL